MLGPSEGDAVVLTGVGDGALCMGVLSGGDDHGVSPVPGNGAAKSVASISGAAAGSGGGWCGGDSDMGAAGTCRAQGERRDGDAGDAGDAGGGRRRGGRGWRWCEGRARCPSVAAVGTKSWTRLLRGGLRCPWTVTAAARCMTLVLAPLCSNRNGCSPETWPMQGLEQQGLGPWGDGTVRRAGGEHRGAGRRRKGQLVNGKTYSR
jgi:hypothetical protein